MSEENEITIPRKSIMKNTAIPRREDTALKRSSLDVPNDSGLKFLGIPAFFFTKATDPPGSRVNSFHSGSFLRVESGDVRKHAIPKVRFLDKLSVKSISYTRILSGASDFYDLDQERQLQFLDFHEDPTYLPGFADLYFATDIAIVEEPCCCSYHTTYKIMDFSSGKLFYLAQKELNGIFMPLLKFFCLRKYDIMRIGFAIQLFTTSVNSSKLLTFKRKQHWFADQLDIVETYYSIENSHVGRIEKTNEGYRLINERGKEMYRVLRESKITRKFFTVGGTLIVFSCETRKVVAKISYDKRKFIGTLCSMFLTSLRHTIRWSSEIEVSMKTLLLGVLFLELHSIEKYVDLPIGQDAYSSAFSPKNRRLSTF